MYPVTHMTIAVGSVSLGRKLLRRLTGRQTAFDYRFVAFGALIPDLIDKPLKWFIFRKQLPDDHTFGHTLLLPTVLTTLGIILARRGDTRLLATGLGCFTHPAVDPVATYPRTLFWPALGTQFPVAKSPLPPFGIPLEIALIVAYALALGRSETVRAAAEEFALSGQLRTTSADEPS